MRGGAFLKGKEGRVGFRKNSFWLKGGRGFQKCIPSNHPITYQRYEKGNRHTPRSIRNIPWLSEQPLHPQSSCRATTNREKSESTSLGRIKFIATRKQMDYTNRTVFKISLYSKWTHRFTSVFSTPYSD